jgi:hypothetical protein
VRNSDKKEVWKRTYTPLAIYCHYCPMAGKSKNERKLFMEIIKYIALLRGINVGGKIL